MKIHEGDLSEIQLRSALGVLRSIPQFDRFTPEEMTNILFNMKLGEVPPGETICMEGEIGDTMYVILNGEVSIHKTGKTERHILCVLEKKSIFGEMSLLDGSPRSASAIADSPLSVLIISKEGIDDLALVDEDLACNFLIAVIKTASSKITETRQRLIRTIAPLFTKE
jgi:CRP-like cAMP-binding protein